MNKTLITTAALALIVGVGVGYGVATALRPASQMQVTRGTFAGGNGGMRGGGAGGFLTGSVAAKDTGTITLNTRDGSSHIVIVTPATSVSKSVSGSLTDVSVGSVITVSGTTNRDGSIVASILQIRPIDGEGSPVIQPQ